MVEKIKSFRVEGSVLDLFPDDQYFYFLSSNAVLYRYDPEKEHLDEFGVFYEEPVPLHPFHKGAALGNGYLGYSMDDDDDCALTYGFSATKTAHGQSVEEVGPASRPALPHVSATHLKGHDQPAEVITIGGEKGEYTFTGGTDGRVYMYDTQSGFTLISFRPTPDYIASICLNKKGSMVAYSSYDKSLILMDLRQQKKLLHKYLGDVIEDTFFYHNDRNVYAIGRDGVSYTFDIHSQEMQKKALFSTWPSCCVLEESGRFAIVGTRGGMIHVVKLEDNSLFLTMKFENKGIASLRFENNILCIGFVNGVADFVDIYAHGDAFTDALKSKDYKKAKYFLDKNLFLAIHPISELFQEGWEHTLKKIIELFTEGKAADALEFAEPFIDDPDRKKEFAFMLQKQNEFVKFNKLVNDKAFHDAYMMLEKYPFLHKADAASRLEGFFMRLFNESKRLLAENPVLNQKKAQVYVKPFLRVPSKEEILKALFKQPTVFVKADEFLKVKDFKSYFILTRQYEFLTELSVYEQVCKLAESGIKKVKTMMAENKLDRALLGIKQIAAFLPYKAELTGLVRLVQLQQNLLRFMAAEEIDKAFALVAENPDLATVEEFKDYNDAFDDTLSKAMLAVGKGEIKQTQTILAPYAKLQIFKPKIKECNRQAAFNHLAQLIRQENLNAAKTIASYYVNEFGKDEEYDRLLKKAGLNRQF